MFRVGRARAQVLNEQISVVTEEVECFVRHVFTKFRLLEIADRPQSAGFTVRAVSRLLIFLRGLSPPSLPTQRR